MLRSRLAVRAVFVFVVLCGGCAQSPDSGKLSLEQLNQHVSELIDTHADPVAAWLLAQEAVAIADGDEQVDRRDLGVAVRNLGILAERLGSGRGPIPLRERVRLRVPPWQSAGDFSQAKYAEAEALYRRSLAIAEQVHGPEHPEVADALSRLVGGLSAQGKLRAAEPFRQRSSALTAKLSERALANQSLSDDPGLFSALIKLSRNYESQGKYAEAERVLKRLLADQESSTGDDSPEYVEVLFHLANIYGKQAKHADAAELYCRRLAFAESTDGLEATELFFYLSDLADSYRTQAKYAEAEALYERALAILQADDAPPDPYFDNRGESIVESLFELARLNEKQSKSAEGRALYERALAAQEKLQARYLAESEENRASEDEADFYYLTIPLNKLADVYREQGRYAEAESAYKRAAAILEEEEGSRRVFLLTSMKGLAEVCLDQEKYAEAEDYYEQALKVLEDASGYGYGPEAPGVGLILTMWGRVYEEQGQFAKAEDIYRRALANRDALPVGDDLVLHLLERLKVVYGKQANYAEAEFVEERLLGIRKKTFGPDHPDVAESLRGLAALYRATGRQAEAETLEKKASRIEAIRAG